MTAQAEDGGVLGDEFTRHVIGSMGPKTPERLREVMSSLIKHVHDFARETRLTTDEWMAGVQMINQAGRMSTDQRNEGQLLCDVLGLESSVPLSASFPSSSPALLNSGANELCKGTGSR